MVVELQLQKCRLADDFWQLFKCEIEDMEQAAALHQLMKSELE